MNESERLAEQLHRALHGNAWHGPSWREVLADVTRDTALCRPVPEAHEIAAIVLHTITWHDAVRRWLGGKAPEVGTAEDWPAVDLPDEASWSAAVDRLFETGDALVERIRAFPAERLGERRPGVDGTWYELLAGELQHVSYHAGQAALLKKAPVAAGSRHG